jgi:hypothetical protein
VAGCCEDGNESSGFVKHGEILDQLRGCQLLKMDSAPWKKYSFIIEVTLPVIEFRVWCSHLNTLICC